MTGAYFNRAWFSRTPFSSTASGTRLDTGISISGTVKVECTVLPAAQTTLAVSLRPGQVAEINTETFEVLIDGKKVLDLSQGLYLVMQPEVTDIFYMDTSNTMGRDLEMTIYYTDHYY